MERNLLTDTIKAKFKNLCPNCGKDIESERLFKGLPCINCLKEEKENFYEELEEGELKKIFNLNKELKEWEKHFENYMKSKPYSLQSTWAKRALLQHSFALLAPTGIGKTSFGIAMASFFARKNKRSYLILPTILLVEQIEKKILNFGVNEENILVFKEEGKGKKEKKKERLKRGDFKILITTSMFLYKNQEIIPKDFDFVFIDDVDSFLKTAQNIDKALYLLGFKEEDIEMAMNLIKLKSKPNKNEEDIEKINKISEYLREISEKKKGVLVVSSATSNPKTNRIRLFRELLGFEVGLPIFYLRNVSDLYAPINEKKLEDWIRLLGKGGLIFLSSDKGKEGVKKIIEELKEKNIIAKSYEEIDDEVLKLYEKGEIDVLVGIASYKNPLARGFDMPHVVKYAIFYGVPKIVISLKFEKNPLHLLWAISSIRSHIVKKFPRYSKKIEYWIKELKKFRGISEEYLETNLKLKERIDKLVKEISEFLKEEEIVKILEESEEIVLKNVEGEYFLYLSDATGYLQASGRTSRMYAGGITKGVSLLLIDEKRPFNHLIKRVRWFSDDIEFKEVNSVNLNEIIKEIEEDRKKIRDFMKGIYKPESREILKPLLIIVESPNKARTIANYFGKPIRRKIFEHDVLETSIEDKYIMITSSLGHILDLNKTEGFHGINLNGEIEPVYEVIEGKEGIIKSLRKMAIESEEILIATDPDTEGEKIGWDIMEILKPVSKNIKRMEFHEVTKRAILKAIKEPRDFDLNLVRAQIVRRIADRWVGFEFSQLLQTSFKMSHLSAGRVQTPVLKWIIEREKEFFKKIYKITVFLDERRKLKVEFIFEDKQEAKKFFDDLKYVDIEILKEEEEIKNPLPPYRTDTMLKDASDRFKFSLPKTMELAQTLFELGFITYHRTDSVRVSDYGLNLAKEYIKEEFGEDYFYGRFWAEGGAHECIRPTKNIDPEDLKSLLLSGEIEGIKEEHILLYSLIFKRFIASQMRPIKLKKLKVLIKTLNREIETEINTDILQDGWNKILYIDLGKKIEGKINVENKKIFKVLPKSFPYTHGELVEEMKRKGIGRPSTYATIIEKLIEREYVIEKNNFLYPTELGKKVYKYLSQREKIKDFLSEEFTGELEKIMDEVEEGKENYQNILKELYQKIININK
ncbi:MAG: reverse gyrase [candidate division WOR-3 bacterium]